MELEEMRAEAERRENEMLALRMEKGEFSNIIARLETFEWKALF